MRILPLVICFFIWKESFGQTTRWPLALGSARTSAYSGMQADVFSGQANQAALISVKKFAAALYGERRFLLPELGHYHFATTVKTGAGHFGLNAARFGATGFNESAFGLAYARQLGKAAIGVQFNYYQMKSAGYEPASAVNFEGGVIVPLSDKLRAGIHLYNPSAGIIKKASALDLPVVYSGGFGYDVSDKVFAGVEIMREEDRPVFVNAGLQYLFDQKIFVNAGISSGTSSFYIGGGYVFNQMKLQFSFSVHPQLGTTPGLLIHYNQKTEQ